jgi:hypothetical protein
MAALETSAGAIGWQAKDFTLEDAYGGPFRLSDLKGPSGTLVMFICTIVHTSARSPTALRGTPSICRSGGGVGVIAAMPNDYVRYPDDAPEQMKRFAEKHNFSFPTSSTRCRRCRGPTTRSAPRFLRLQRRHGAAVPGPARWLLLRWSLAGLGDPHRLQQLASGFRDQRGPRVPKHIELFPNCDAARAAGRARLSHRSHHRNAPCPR